MPRYTGEDVLTRARAILVATGVQGAHGRYCPWCALADAHGQLADEHGVPAVAQISGLNDFPLWEAKVLLGGEHQADPLDQEQALALIDAVLEQRVREG